MRGPTLLLVLLLTGPAKQDQGPARIERPGCSVGATAYLANEPEQWGAGRIRYFVHPDHPGCVAALAPIRTWVRTYATAAGQRGVDAAEWGVLTLTPAEATGRDAMIRARLAFGSGCYPGISESRSRFEILAAGGAFEFRIGDWPDQ